MRRTLLLTVTIAGFGAVLWAVSSRAVVAQETQNAREQRRATQPPALVVPSVAQDEQARRLPAALNEPADEETLADNPKEIILFTLWVLSVTDSDKLPADELRDKSADEITNLPAVVGSIRDVRELISRVRVAGLLRSVREYRLIALDGESVTTQIGRNQPRIVQTNVDDRAGRTNVLQLEPLGTIIELRPRIRSELNVLVSVKFNQSEMEKSTDVLITEPVEGTALYADVVTTRQFEATTSLKNDTAVLLQSTAASASQGDASDVEMELMILGAAIVPASL